MFTRRVIAPVIAIGALSVISVGVAVAISPAPPYKACANAMNQLTPVNAHSACQSGSTRVALGRPGPIGSQGPAGNVGPPGPRGDAGQRGFRGVAGSIGYTDSWVFKGARESLGSFTLTNVAQIQLPAGYYLVRAHAYAVNLDGDPQNVTCRLDVNYNDSFDGTQEGYEISSAPSNSVPFLFDLETPVVYTQAGYAVLECDTYNGAAYYPTIDAVKIAATH